MENANKKQNRYITIPNIIPFFFFILFSGATAFGQCGTTYTTNTTVSGFTASGTCIVTVEPGVTLTIQNGGMTLTGGGGGSLLFTGGGTVTTTLGFTLSTGAYNLTVGRGTSVTMGALNMNNPANLVVVEQGATLTVGGGDNVNGTIIDSGSVVATGSFSLGNNGTITGTGTLTIPTGDLTNNGNGNPKTNIFGGNPSSCNSGCGSCGTAFTATATSSSSSICSGSSSTLTAHVSAGTATAWQWGNNSGNIVGATNSTYTATTAGTYYVTVTEGSCSNTATVTLGSTTTAPTTTAGSVCGTGTVTLTASGAPSGGTYNWYAASTGGTALQSSTSTTYTTPSISSTTTYYVTALSSGGCESATRTSVVASVYTAPSTPSSTALGNGATVCTNTSGVTYSIPTISGATYLWSVSSTYGSINGGNTNNSVVINWGGTTGTTNLTVTTSPGNCSASLPVTISSGGTLKTISSATASPATICSGGSSTLTATLSATGVTGTPVWYTASCGGTKVGSGTSISVSPTNTTTYYVRDEINGSCGTATTCATVVVTVAALNTISTVSAASTIAAGASSSLSATLSTGGTNGTITWYTGSCGGTVVGTGSPLSVSPTNTTTYYVGDVSTGCTSTACTTTVVTVVTSENWAGGAAGNTTDWNTAANWNPPVVPTSGVTVTIPSAATAPHQPVISSTTTASVNGITLSSSTSSLTLSSGSALNIYGNFTNTAGGTVTDNGGTTTFEGTSAQTFSGPSAGTTFSSLTLNNSSGLTLSNPLTVTGILTLTSGNITSSTTTPAYLTVNLYKGGISGLGSGGIINNLTVTKKVDTAGYHYISEPIPNCTVSDIDVALVTNTEYYGTLFWYNETNTSCADSIGWTAANNTTNFPAYPSLTQMHGFAQYFFVPGTLSFTKSYTSNSYTPSIALTSTKCAGGGMLAEDGWNLVGNPYPSSIDWNASSGWTKTGIDNAVYYYNPATHNYASYVGGASANGGTNIIPSMQAFWVHVSTDGGSGTLGVTNSVRSTTSSPLLWRTAVRTNYMTITATGPDSVTDQTTIRLLPDATYSLDPNYDAYKLMGDAGYPNLFTTIGNTQYSINTLPQSLSDYSLPLNFVANTSGIFNFTVKDVASFAGEVLLVDNLTNTQQDLKTFPTYSFSAIQGDTSARFYINFNPTASVVTGLIASKTGNSSNVIIINNNTGVVIDFLNTISHNADISVYNILGQNIWENKNTDISSGSYSINSDAFPAGIYILKVIIDSKIYSKKIYLVK